MAIVILALLIAFPLIEISVFIEVGGEIGVAGILGITVLTAVVGLYIVRLEGLVVMARMRRSMEMGEVPLNELFHGFFLFLAGVLLLIPGFVSDGIGALLLIPPVRSFLARPVIAKTLMGNPQPKTYRDAAGNLIIDGVYREEEADSGEGPSAGQHGTVGDGDGHGDGNGDRDEKGENP